MSEEPKRSIIFTDVDGTLVFRKGIHDIDVVNDVENGISQVVMPNSTKPIDAHKLASAPNTKAYISVQTRLLAKTLMEQADIFIATAGNPNIIKKRKAFFDFAKGFILQSGGGIYDSNLVRDDAWHNHLAPERVSIKNIKKSLESKNIKFLDRWEDAALRIRAKDNLHLSQTDFEATIENLELPEDLKLTRNLDHFDIILASAGKDNAANYLIDRDEYKRENSYGIGDDVNDIPMFEQVDHGFVLGSGYPEAINYARQNSLYISKGIYFDGINEIFEEIRQRIVRS